MTGQLIADYSEISNFIKKINAKDIRIKRRRQSGGSKLDPNDCAPIPLNASENDEQAHGKDSDQPTDR